MMSIAENEMSIETKGVPQEELKLPDSDYGILKGFKKVTQVSVKAKKQNLFQKDLMGS